MTNPKHAKSKTFEIDDFMRTCPYPHSHETGPSPALLVAAPDEAALATCTAPGCLQTSFFCPACGASNRTLAKFCRNCRQPLTFETTVARAHVGVEISQAALTKGARQVALSRLQGRAITALCNAWGYLVLAAQDWGLGLMANTSMNPPRLLAHFPLEHNDEIVTLQPMTFAEASPAVLAVGRKTIHVLTSLPHFDCRMLFRNEEAGWQIESTLVLHENVVVRLYHSKTKAYRWLVLTPLTGKMRELAVRTRGPLSAMIAVPDSEKFFCATEAEVVQYDLEKNLEQRFAGPPLGLNLKVRPQVHPRTGEVFWHGLDGFVYRHGSHAKALKAFGRQRGEVVHFFCSAYDDFLYLLTPDNIVVLDYPSANPVWNFAEKVQMKIACSLAPPRALGNYLLFAFRSPSLVTAEERVGLFSLAQREAPLLLHPAVAATPMPIAGVAHIIAVRKPQASEERAKSALILFQV